MSQTALETLWHLLGLGPKATPPDRPTNDSAGPVADPLVPDGGESAEREDDDHLRDVPDGAGCTEIWEYLSERQAPEAETDD